MSLFRGAKESLGNTVIAATKIDDPALIVTSTDAGQTGTLLTAQNSAGTVVASISNAGLVTGASFTGQRVVLTADLLAASVPQWLFVADRAYIVTAVNEVHSVAGGASAAVRPRKILAANVSTPAAAVAAGITEITTAAVDLTAAINVSQAGTLSATASDYTLAAGDKIALNFTGTLTALVGKISIVLKAV